MTAAYDEPCGQRAVLTQGLPGDAGGYMSGVCVVLRREKHTEHRDADGHTWIESVR